MELERQLHIARTITKLLDAQFSVMGYKFGFNGLAGLFPAVGDIIITIVSFYLVWLGIKMNIPKIKLIQMMGNVGLNFLVGLVPVIGDAADFFTKSNYRNMAILEQYAPKAVIEGEVIESSKK